MSKIQAIPYRQLTENEISSYSAEKWEIVEDIDNGVRKIWDGSNWKIIDDNTIYVKSKADLPQGNGLYIELEEGKTYILLDNVDLENEYLVLKDHVVIEGFNSFTAGLNYTGTGAILRNTDCSVKIKNLSITSNEKIFEFHNVERNKHVVLEHLIIQGNEVGIFEGFGAIDFDNINWLDISGLQFQDVKNIMFVRQFMNISAPLNYNYTSDQTSSEVGNDEVVLYIKEHGIGTEKYLYKNISGSVIIIDDNTDYTIDTNWEVINKPFLEIKDTTQNIYKIQCTHSKFQVPTGYIAIKGNENNIVIDGIIAFVGNLFDGDGIYIDGIDINAETDIVFTTNLNLRNPDRLPRLTTGELNNISNPGIGDTFFNIDEGKVAVFTEEGWKLLLVEDMYTTIFEATFETDNDGFIFVNDDTNQWIRNTLATNDGTYSIYISNDGSNPTYTNNVSQVSHAYIDISVPTGITGSKLEFDWKAEGERNYDYLRIYKTDTSYTPTAGSLPSSTYLIGESQYNDQTVWSTESIDLGTDDAGTTIRIIFTWRNDSSVGSNPAACVDNVKFKITN